jgi:hypothetical protein
MKERSKGKGAKNADRTVRFEIAEMDLQKRPIDKHPLAVPNLFA